mgnify:CR=1 FL=1
MAPINKPATIQKAKQFLQDYPVWQAQAAGFSQTLATKTHPATSAASQADFECQLRLKTLSAMRSLAELDSLYAEILTDRFIKQLSIKQTCVAITDLKKYGYLTERSCNRYQNKALLLFAYACPRNLIVNQ